MSGHSLQQFSVKLSGQPVHWRSSSLYRVLTIYVLSHRDSSISDDNEKRRHSQSSRASCQIADRALAQESGTLFFRPGALIGIGCVCKHVRALRPVAVGSFCTSCCLAKGRTGDYPPCWAMDLLQAQRGHDCLLLAEYDRGNLISFQSV